MQQAVGLGYLPQHFMAHTSPKVVQAVIML